MVNQGHITYKRALVNSAASGDRVLVTAVANNRIQVHAVCLVSDSATKGTIRFESEGGGTALSGVIEMGHDDGTRIRPTTFLLPFSEVPWMVTDEEALATDDDLSLEVGGSAIDGVIIYSLLQVR